jgi:hypothetical protein
MLTEARGLFERRVPDVERAIWRVDTVAVVHLPDDVGVHLPRE